ncbi:MAG: four helix bundle protein [Geobacteraceae bacterium GWC2_58_44]|nr:MAG: four helix bundle protein [Geobacteraceae bacterium GWC2_58_44]HBG07699.1 diversity-generating retroelement protein Avd [Geobacter sp.]
MENLKIKLKVEDMIKYGYPALAQFPKSEKFSLVQDIKKTMHSLLEQVIRANRTRDKRMALHNVDVELEILRTQIRLATELKLLPLGKYETWSNHLAEIGRMLGGWLKSVNKG